MHRVVRLLYRDRRRLSFCALCLTLSWAIGGDSIPDAKFMPGELPTIVVMLVVMGLIAVARPRYRHLVERVALTNLVFVSIGRVVPGSNFNVANPGTDFIASSILFGALFIVLQVVVAGRWSDRFTLPHAITLRSHVTTPLEARDVWYGLVPTPGHLDESPDPEVVSIDYADSSRRRIRVLSWHPPQGQSETFLHVEALVPFRYARTRVELAAHRRYGAPASTSVVQVRDLGDRRRIENISSAAHMPVRMLVRSWMDDTLGRMLDLRLGRIEANVAQMIRSPGGVRVKRPSRLATTRLYDNLYAPGPRERQGDRPESATLRGASADN